MSEDTSPGQGEPVEFLELVDLVEKQGATSLADGLRRAGANRIQRLFFLMTAPPLCFGFEDVVRYLSHVADVLLGAPPVAVVSQLATRARTDVEEALDATLAGNHGPLANNARDLMEIEWLVRDFARDPDQVAVWEKSLMSARRRKFDPAALRRRLAEAEHPGLDLPETLEYQAHSESLHVTPNSVSDFTGRKFTHEHHEWLIIFWVSEVLEHAQRVICAFDEFVKRVGLADRVPVNFERLGYLQDSLKLCRDVVAELHAQTALPPREPRPKGTKLADIN